MDDKQPVVGSVCHLVSQQTVQERIEGGGKCREREECEVEKRECYEQSEWSESISK